MKYCDLHMHSTASDGTDLPEALPRLAVEAGLSAIALTDHDSTVGLAACASACEQAGIGFIPGIEISSDLFKVLPDSVDDATRKGTLHLLGYGIQHDHAVMRALHEEQVAIRDGRNAGIVRKLQGLGIDISMAEVEALAREQGTAAIGRPHIAQVLIGKGIVETVTDAFRQYIGHGGPAYDRRDRLAPDQAIAQIHEAGGLAVLAHPIQLRCEDEEELTFAVQTLVDCGLDGIETRHSDHGPEHVARYHQIAKQFGLLETGGSDYHGYRKHVVMGSEKVALSVYENLRATMASR